MTNRIASQYFPSTLMCCGNLIRVLLIILRSLGIYLWLQTPVQATVDNWDIEGAGGVLYVHGELTESACRLEMASAYQDIILGEIGTGHLRESGAQGEPIHFKLQLTDCLRSPANSRDERTGGLTWADNQPAVVVSFSSTRDEDNPQLMKVQGEEISGLGLRLSDSLGQDVRLGSRGKPLLMAPGQDVLNYTVTPERTSAALLPGSYWAVVNFHLNYD